MTEPGYDQKTRTMYMTQAQWETLQLALPGLHGMRDPWSRMRHTLRWLDADQWNEFIRDVREMDGVAVGAVRLLTAPRIVVIPEPESHIIASGHNWRVVQAEAGVALEVKDDNQELLQLTAGQALALAAALSEAAQ